MLDSLEKQFNIPRDYFKKKFGVFMDEPDKLEDENEARAILGFVLP